MTPRFRLLVVGLLVAIVATACNVTTTVDIRVDEDGSGGVAVGVGLDDEAVAVVPELGSILRVEDLAAVGWVVTGPEVESDGLTWIRAAKEFSTPEQLQDVLDEITGPEGAFQDFEILRDEAFAELSWRVNGLIDLTAGEELFSDSELTAALGGATPFGPVGEDLSGELGDLTDAIDVTVAVRLPGDVEGVSGETTFTPSFDDDEATVVSVTSVREDFGPTLWRWVGRAALVLFALAVVLAAVSFWYERRVRRRQPAVRTPEPLRAEVPAAAGAPGAARRRNPTGRVPGSSPTRPGSSRRLRLVVVDALTVLHRGGDATDTLVPFARELGSEVPDAEIVEAHRQATLGRIDTAELWAACGVVGEASVLDGQYLSRIPLTPGVRDFLLRLQRERIPVAAITNDVAAWSQRLRDRNGLDSVHPWIVSSREGVRKPDPAIYEVMRRTTTVPFDSWLMIDTRVSHLDAARTLGMETAWFTTDDAVGDGGDHTAVNGFAGFFRKRR